MLTANVSGDKSGAVNALRPGVKLWISGESRILGPGAVKLLAFVEKTGSLKQACFEMSVSYSKARKMVSEIERQLDCDIVHKRQGGKYGGSTILTENGKDLVERYEAFLDECTALVNESFDKHFDGFLSRQKMT